MFWYVVIRLRTIKLIKKDLLIDYVSKVYDFNFFLKRYTLKKLIIYMILIKVQLLYCVKFS